MGSPGLDQDISPIPRSREENQERAFIAASRRKDRSLDARLESANRASMLHKKRTGRAFHITKEIVEKEAMYEEVDERYQEKRIRMLQAQNMQIEEQFHRHLLAAFAARASGSGSASSSIASRRTSMSARGSVDVNARKMSLDLSNLRSAFPQDAESGPLTSPMVPANDGCVLSPTATFDSGPPSSYMTCMNGSDPSYNFMASSTAGTTSATTATTASAQIPAYVTQQAPTPVWSSQVPPAWASLQSQQQMPTPGQTPTDTTAVHLWQQQMMQQAQMPSQAATAAQMRQFRDRLASAPELPVQHNIPPAAPSGSVSGHSRGSSQPTNNFHNLHLLTQGTHLASQMPSHSSGSSPKLEVLSAETKSTPDFCPTPNTPLSPTNRASMPATTKESEGIMVSHENLDPDFNEFSEFALGLGNSSHPHLQDREQFGFDDFVALDDFATVSC